MGTRSHLLSASSCSLFTVRSPTTKKFPVINGCLLLADCSCHWDYFAWVEDALKRWVKVLLKSYHLRVSQQAWSPFYQFKFLQYAECRLAAHTVKSVLSSVSV